MKRVGKFEKVSYEQFKKDWVNTFELDDKDETLDQDIKRIYDSIELPTRATAASAGYDFKAPLTFTLEPGDAIKIPTGIRCWMNDNYVLMIIPRSGLGFKYRETIANTIAAIDADFFYSDNEGHIFIKLVNCGDKDMKIYAGDKFVQGIFIEYGITVDDNVRTKRNGGLGSTGL